MLYIKEVDLISYAKELPVLKSECPANNHTKREEVKTIINDINKQIPGVRDMLFTALTHPDRYNLFDKYIAQIDEI